MRTVYAVTHGDYSSYMVLCLFETKELAEAYIEALHQADDRREEAGPDEWRRFGDRESRELCIEEFELWDVVPVVTIPEWGFRDDVVNEEPRGGCAACGHPTHVGDCAADIMVGLKERTALTPPFHLQCHCDEESGPVVVTTEGRKPLYDVYERVTEGRTTW